MHKRFWKMIGLLALIFMMGGPVYAHEGSAEHRVLFISSYSPGFMTFSDQVDGMEGAFKRQNVSLDIEFMDSKRIDTQESVALFDANLSYKLSQLKPYDLVLVADDNALRYMMEVHDTLFDDVPVVFFGINDSETAIEAAQDEWFTGVVEAVSTGDTILTAARLNPAATRVVALTDGTTTGQADLDTFYGQQEVAPWLEYDALDLSELTFDAFNSALGELSNQDIVLLLSLYTDKTGMRITFWEGLDMVFEHTDQPVYHIYSHGIGEGLAGGRVISHFEQGRLAGEMALELLHGGAVSDFPLVLESPNAYLFDEKVLLEAGYPVQLLPQSATLVNRETRSLTDHWPYFLAGTVVIILQTSIIQYLRLTIRRKNQMHEELTLSKHSLESINRQLNRANRELTHAFNEVEEQNQQIHDLIYLDELTGLSNRFAIMELIEDWIDASDSPEPFTVMFLDVDNFKLINDTFGHDIGDEVIRVTGSKLRQLQDRGFRIGRFGGDEFILAVKGEPDEEELITIVEGIKRSFAQEIEVAEKCFYLTVSLGIVRYPQHGNTKKELIKRADLALYEAKNAGKNRFVLFDDSLNHELEWKIELQSAIRDAMNRQAFELKYQPIVRASDGKIESFEALIRWQCEKIGRVPAFDLICNAEEMGMIAELGDWIVREAFGFARRLNEGREDPVVVAINLSGIQLRIKGFADHVAELARSTGVEPEWIIFEMTETILIQSVFNGDENLWRLKELGFGLSLDDFGTGYSSLRYLKDFPVKAIKIDREFVEHIAESDYESQLIDAMIEIAGFRSLSVVAEGVETQLQSRILRDSGCDAMQGYLFSDAVSEAEAYRMVIEERHFLELMTGAQMSAFQKDDGEGE